MKSIRNQNIIAEVNFTANNKILYIFILFFVFDWDNKHHFQYPVSLLMIRISQDLQNIFKLYIDTNTYT